MTCDNEPDQLSGLTKAKALSNHMHMLSREICDGQSYLV